MAAVLMLGFASGFPLYLTSRTLQAWMTVAGVNLSAIGFFSLVSLPYSLKFLWSPIIDRFCLPFLGRRKGWLFVTQVALGLAIAAMIFARPSQVLRLLAINAFIIAFLSATQDIVVDAYVTDISDASEVGAASGVKVLGYRIAMIATGGGALVIADFISWQTVYFLMGVLMLVLAAISARVPEPVLRDRPPVSMNEAIRMPLADFFARSGTGRGVWILAFILLYRLGDSMINNMTTPFLIQAGFSQTDIGLIQGGVGLFATIAGVLAGGVVIARIGINRSLWVFGILQAASNFCLSRSGLRWKRIRSHGCGNRHREHLLWTRHRCIGRFHHEPVQPTILRYSICIAVQFDCRGKGRGRVAVGIDRGKCGMAHVFSD